MTCQLNQYGDTGGYRVGDHVRVIAIPEAVIDEPNSQDDGLESTFKVLNWIKKNRIICPISTICEYNWLWIDCQKSDTRGTMIYHSIKIEAECLELVTRPEHKQIPNPK